MMRNISVIMISVVLLSGCDDKTTTACEEALLARLKSPSSYKRIELSRRESEANRTDYALYLQADDVDNDTDVFAEKLAAFDRAPEKPKMTTLVFSYDAANSFGAILRGSATCEFVSFKDEQPWGYSAVVLDGKTQSKWILDGIKEQAN